MPEIVIDICRKLSYTILVTGICRKQERGEDCVETTQMQKSVLHAGELRVRTENSR